MTAPTSELTFFDESEELDIGKKFEEFLKNKARFEISDPFVIGKYNFKNNGNVTYFCGHFKTAEDQSSYFRGAIDGSGMVEWDGMQEQSAWCTIKDDAYLFNFVNDQETRNEN